MYLSKRTASLVNPNCIGREFPNKMEIEILEPDECPCCSRASNPLFVQGNIFYLGNNRATFGLMFLCCGCNNFYIIKGSIQNFINPMIHWSQLLDVYCAPISVKKEPEEKAISDISPNFYKIYNECLAAEANELNNIAGMAFRKALEILIKDFCIFLFPEEKEDIINESLGNCIKNRLNNLMVNDVLKVLSKKCKILGNDFTHYNRVYGDKEISDMKQYIKSIMHLVACYGLAKEEL